MWPDLSRTHHCFKYFPFHVNVNLSSHIKAKVEMETSSSHKKREDRFTVIAKYSKICDISSLQ